jgi:hypothetical protein
LQPVHGVAVTADRDRYDVHTRAELNRRADGEARP